MLAFYLSALETNEERDRLTYYYEKYKQLFSKIAYGYLYSETLAEDAVHNAFLTVINDKEKILSLPDANFRSWCVIIIRSRCIDMLRKNKAFDDGISFDREDAPEIMSDEPLMEERLIENERIENLEKCLSKLDPEAKNILEMKYVLNLSFTDICERTGMTFDQVNGILRRARKKLKSMLESEV
jgi:RNA polymerase sigma-70 factor (ECF subfamily)